jgi:transposase
MIAFRSHWGFASEYCRPARGNEKGGVEMELGWFRRNWLVPVPEADDLESFNAWLCTRCGETQQHVTWVMHTKSTPRDDSARLVAGRQ